MSLRPSFAGFDLNKLKALFGCKDSESIKALVASYAKFAYDDNEVRRAEQVFREIINGEVIQNPPMAENQIFQNAMACLVEYNQKPNYSESIFWEALLVDVEQTQENMTVLLYAYSDI